MNKKVVALMIAVMMVFAASPSAFAIGAQEAASSLLLPTTGQAMNGELGATKTKIMAGLEVGLITTVAILGGVVGGGVVWAGLGPLIANHLWAASDAYQSAQSKRDPVVAAQMADAQRTLEYSRQRRFDREQEDRNGLRERMRQAAEYGYNS